MALDVKINFHFLIDIEQNTSLVEQNTVKV